MIITINLSSLEKVSVLGNPKMTTAPLDSLTNHCHSVDTGNENSTARSKRRGNPIPEFPDRD
jgi:hypothetical protein